MNQYYNYNMCEYNRQRTHYVYEYDQRSKAECPYSYSPFFLLGNHNTIENSSADYSDRLFEWDYNKYRKAAEEMGCNFGRASFNDVNKFLKIYYGVDCVCTGLAEGCNPSNGYPYWIIWYKKS